MIGMPYSWNIQPTTSVCCYNVHETKERGMCRWYHTPCWDGLQRSWLSDSLSRPLRTSDDWCRAPPYHTEHLLTQDLPLVPDHTNLRPPSSFEAVKWRVQYVLWFEYTMYQRTSELSMEGWCNVPLTHDQTSQCQTLSTGIKLVRPSIT